MEEWKAYQEIIKYFCDAFDIDISTHKSSFLMIGIDEEVLDHV